MLRVRKCHCFQTAINNVYLNDKIYLKRDKEYYRVITEDNKLLGYILGDEMMPIKNGYISNIYEYGLMGHEKKYIGIYIMINGQKKNKPYYYESSTETIKRQIPERPYSHNFRSMSTGIKYFNDETTKDYDSG